MEPITEAVAHGGQEYFRAKVPKCEPWLPHSRLAMEPRKATSLAACFLIFKKALRPKAVLRVE